MEEVKIQDQIDDIHRKMDLVLEYIEEQRKKNETYEDLVKDASIVAKDAFNQTVQLLEKSQIELDSCGLSCLLIKLLQNLGTFYEMLEMMESARDFMKDFSPVIRQMGLDAVNKMNELDQKGYFEYLIAMGRIVEKWIQTYTVQDMNNLENNLDNFASILRDLTNHEMTGRLTSVTHALSTIKMDDKMDNISYWKLFKKMRSKEVKKSLSYTLRLIEAINRQN
ncbi:MAG: hypothetical protein NTX61_18600 [Bacteroidetes bacterium]|nr:hypothetical protein [Bacteroidota bacterium]